MPRNLSLTLPVNTFTMPADIRALINTVLTSVNWQNIALMLILIGAIIYLQCEADRE